MLRSTITYPCGERERSLLWKALEPELTSHKSDRATITHSQGAGNIKFNIKADDITSLRAAFNSLTKLISVHIELQNIK
jgi:tRNA threonylcarbamoyladenosine modification (KEOPS) complex  Pcc1 subunit